MLSVCVLYDAVAVYFFFQAEDGIRDAQESRGLGDVYKRQAPELPDEATTTAIVEDIRSAAYRLDSLKTTQRNLNPSAPFITSTLQQEASRKLGFPSKKTMMIAQQLYEGIDIGNGGETGLITYMRTDSVHVAPQAVEEARAFILKLSLIHISEPTRLLSIPYAVFCLKKKTQNDT